MAGTNSNWMHTDTIWVPAYTFDYLGEGMAHNADGTLVITGSDLNYNTYNNGGKAIIFEEAGTITHQQA